MSFGFSQNLRDGGITLLLRDHLGGFTVVVTNARIGASGQESLASSVLAAVYIWLMLFAGGSKLLLLSSLLYLPATALFVHAMREQKRTVFTRVELVLVVLLAVCALIGVYGLTSGTIMI